MAALDAFDRPTATMSVAVDAETLRQTSPRMFRSPPRWNGRFSSSPRGNTVPDVDPAEKGDEEERNQASATEIERERSATKEPPSNDGEGSRVRSELARDLLQRIDQLIPLLGDISLATNIELLKRDLSHCHDVLKAHPSESDFLSIITLVESAMAQTKWKQYNRLQLEAIREACDIGYRQVQVRFSDYVKARELVAAKALETTPRIDLEKLSLEDITDGEEA
jgi:hypothetical protein